MATRTISNAGGNWNATGTWVEGVVPVAADDIVATATSGNLTMNVSASCRSVNFTNYVGTITMNNNLAIGGASVTNTFVNTMTIAGTSRIRLTGINTLVTNGLYIPVLEATTTTTLTGNLNCGNLFLSTGSLTGSDIISNGNIETTVAWTMTGYKLRMVGTASHTIRIVNYTGQLEIDSSGTFSFTNASGLTAGAGLQLRPGATVGTTFSYINGNLVNPDIRITPVAGLISLNTASYSPGLNSVLIKVADSGDTNLTLSSDLVYKNLVIMTEFYTTNATTTKRSLNFIGPGVLSATASGETFILPSFRGSTTINSWYTIGQNIRFQAGLTYSLGNLYSYGVNDNITGVSDGNHLFFSSSAGTKAGINVVGTQSINFTDFTDISAAQPVYTLLGQTSNVTNITSIDRYYYTPGGGGVAGGSFTFVQ